jgi:hypothetical protein
MSLLENFLVSPDILHNCMDLTETLLEYFLKDVWLDVDIFNSKLRSILHREFLSSCKGFDLRFIVLNWEQSFIPLRLILLASQQELFHKFFLFGAKFFE